jgi:sucrose-6-phosphate hydrolase SacC (GH32 family)
MEATNFQWQKRGLLFRAEGQHGWMNSHAQVPTVLPRPSEGIVRVYFATRPHSNLSLTTFVDLDASDLTRQVYLNPEPLLPLGGLGMFDEHGLMPSSVVEHDGAVFLYYSGWSRGTTLPYANFTGLAVSKDGGRTFEKIGPGPIIDRTYWGPYSATSPHVFIHGGQWYMIYCSGIAWVEISGKLEHTYDLKLARSHDGIRWEQTGQVVVPQSRANEAITKPTVLYENGRFHLWFCFRSSELFRGGEGSYRIGYASSTDLFDWERNDTVAGISPGPDDWDSGMLAYPEVALLGGKASLFYNGNYFGRDGFGCASRIMLS